MKRRQPISRSFFVLGAFVIVMCLAACCPIEEERLVISGESLAPMVADGTVATLQRGYYACHDPERDDLVAYDYAGRDLPLAKVVKGIPGDRLRVEDSALYINGDISRNSGGTPFSLSDREMRMLGLYADSYPVIPEDAYLLMGERSGAIDGGEFGLVARQDLIGRIVLQ
jgi:signal peptidase I